MRIWYFLAPFLTWTWIQVSHAPHLGLDVITRHNVAYSSQGWRSHFIVVVPIGRRARGLNSSHLPCTKNPTSSSATTQIATSSKTRSNPTDGPCSHREEDSFLYPLQRSSSINGFLFTCKSLLGLHLLVRPFLMQWYSVNGPIRILCYLNPKPLWKSAYSTKPSFCNVRALNWSPQTDQK